MKRVFIIHGWSGSPHEHWLPWLSSELVKKGCEILVPEMPNPDNPVIEQWVAKLSSVVGSPDKDTYFVGHSIGCQAILRYLDLHLELTRVVGGAVFVAGWFNLENLEDESKGIAHPWIEQPIHTTHIKAVLPKSSLIISDNDPYGAFEENKEKFEKLGSKILVLKNAGHICAEDGFTELPIALSELEEMMDSTINE